MSFLNQLHQQLGLMSWPLLLCSVITLALWLERTLSLLWASLCGEQEKRHLRLHGSTYPEEDIDVPKSLILQGCSLLVQHKGCDKTTREDLASVWLQQQRRRLYAGLRVLTLVGVISPLLGLLGTVLGLIEMFKSVGESGDPVTPALLADGLGLAMSTTAAGLLIALPAIAGAQLFGLWADRLLDKLTDELNRCNLHLEGIRLEAR
ncbi:MotA/TolQ/ExbB proton channel family protein [Oceanisphaera arctica]|uniref:Biopolymer transporter ExbB n=1 Tax=Oceanisphaera arctica TaxID=641510 RepID=A0A2P5TQC5_9GAMM|nr:MotA/TolQ/ExbB proton channel family protein [Oceanisphaera arctica]PPL17890.1 biopolymer transporter ExbB [Oceanisphaera arctica]GHA23845.1 biopolymer transport protein exbB1 [Oceanisphaera arctica]